MTQQCVHVEYELVVTAEEWSASCEAAADKLRQLPGLEWKLWLVDAAARSGGGIYLFRTAADADTFVHGPVLDGLRTNPAVRDVRVRSYAINAALSARTFALRAGTAADAPAP